MWSFSTLPNFPGLITLTVAGHLEPEEIAHYLSLGYNLQEKTEFANPKVHLAEEVALEMPTGQSTGGFKYKGTDESIQVMAFLRSPSSVFLEFLGFLNLPLDQSQLYFPGR